MRSIQNVRTERQKDNVRSLKSTDSFPRNLILLILHNKWFGLTVTQTLYRTLHSTDSITRVSISVSHGFVKHVLLLYIVL